MTSKPLSLFIACFDFKIRCLKSFNDNILLFSLVWTLLEWFVLLIWDNSLFSDMLTWSLFKDLSDSYFFKLSSSSRSRSKLENFLSSSCDS